MLGGLRLAALLLAACAVGLMPMRAVDAAQKNATSGSVSSARQSAAPGKKKQGASSTARSAKTRSAAKGKAKKAVAKKTPAARKAAVTRGTPAVGGQRLEVKSGAALVVEQAGGEALFQKNADAVVPIASITKLMTAMVVLDDVPSLQARIGIAEADVDYLRGSGSRLHVGADMTRETALLLALMSSENRAAHALARHYPGGMPVFLAAMNAKARSLGMRDTYFEDPTGLSRNNVSTALDLAKMVAAAHRYPLIREFSTKADAVVEIGGRQMEFNNTNPLVKNAGWDVGVSKTGYINEAGKCLVMQARVARKPVVIVLLDSSGKLTRVGDANRIKRWMEETLASRDAGMRQASTGSVGPG
jgi:D-alanyl-D-alanine endopeptidase (penicillin-binding protein 7)